MSLSYVAFRGLYELFLLTQNTYDKLCMLVKGMELFCLYADVSVGKKKEY